MSSWFQEKVDKRGCLFKLSYLQVLKLLKFVKTFHFLKYISCHCSVLGQSFKNIFTIIPKLSFVSCLIK